MEEPPRQTTSNLKLVRLQNELRQMDWEWEVDQEAFYPEQKDETKVKVRPTRAAAIGASALFAMVASSAAYLYCIYFLKPPTTFLGICALIVVVAISLSLPQLANIHALEKAESAYLQRRKALLQQIIDASQTSES